MKDVKPKLKTSFGVSSRTIIITFFFCPEIGCQHEGQGPEVDPGLRSEPHVRPARLVQEVGGEGGSVH